MNEQARRSTPPNRVRLPTDRQFASGCSPRRLAPTQLPSATELWHTPTWTFTMLMWRPYGRTHSGQVRDSGREPESRKHNEFWIPALTSLRTCFRGNDERRAAE